MRIWIPSFISLIALSLAAATVARYPKAPKTRQVDEYHGTKIADPYRELENPDSPATRAWIEAENRLTRSFFSKIPGRERIRSALEGLWNYERNSPPFREASRYFFTRNSGLQNQSVLLVQDSLDGAPRVLLDPNALSSNGTVSLAGYAVSHDGNLLAYGTSAAGSDWNEWKVRNIETGKDTDDLLKWVKFSGASWAPDNRGFYYSRYDEPPAGRELQSVVKNQKVWFHRLGTPQSRDEPVFARPDKPDWFFSADVTDGGRWLILTVREGTDPRNRLYYRDLEKPGSDFVKLFDRYDARYQFLDDVGSTFYFQTDKDAPRGRVVSVDVSPGQAEPALHDVVPQAAASLEGVSIVGERIVAQYLVDAASRVRLFSLDGKPEKEIELPALGAAGGFFGKRSDKETFYSFVSFSYPVRIYRYDFETGKSSVFREPKVPFDPARFETREVFYPSKDGTKIPMFLVSRKGLKQTGDIPTLLFGYGGFDLAMTPAYSARALAWIEMGGLFAHACLRGGSEYGEEWHRAGMLGNKQNVFDDFAWAAKWLIAKGYTNPKRLAINGRSNGGLLVGATLNQHPELFGAAVPQVGVMDMLRYHLFTIGWAWASDYGRSDKPDQFAWLIRYSPLHNIKKGTHYPPVLITTADHDDRVVPGHSFKYAATLQAAQAGTAPILIRIETQAGHGGGGDTGSETSVSKQIEESSDILAFLFREIGGLKAP